MTASLPADLLCSPATRLPVTADGAELRAGDERFAVTPSGVPLFAPELGEDARRQQAHYDRIAAAYVANLDYPHTREYMAYLDRALSEAVGGEPLGTMAELCCGTGEAAALLGDRCLRAVGVDVSLAMLERARRRHAADRFAFVQGDATRLPLRDGAFDSVVMLGGIHHVRDRQALFGEIARILRPGGRFIWREPVSDFALWRWIRAIVYRLSPLLDDRTERPLLWQETVPVLAHHGLLLERWRTYGFLGFCVLMNSDVLVFNRAFRFVPGIRAITRAFVRLDDWTVRAPGLERAGLQVVGVARKPQH